MCCTSQETLYIILYWMNFCSLCVLLTCLWVIERSLLCRQSHSFLFTNTPRPCIPHEHAYTLMLPTLNTLASAPPRLSHVSLFVPLSPSLSSVTLPHICLTSFCVHALYSSFFLLYSVFLFFVHTCMAACVLWPYNLFSSPWFIFLIPACIPLPPHFLLLFFSIPVFPFPLFPLSRSLSLSVSSPLNVLGSVRHSSSSLSSHTSSETGNLLILTDSMMEHPEDLYRMQVGYMSS